MYRKYFDPLDYNLSADFRLTKLADLKGWGCKVPRDVLHRLLEGLQTADKNGYGDGQHHQGLVPESKPTPVVGMFSRFESWEGRSFLSEMWFFSRNWPWFMRHTHTAWRAFSGTINCVFLSTCWWSICDGNEWIQLKFIRTRFSSG